VLYHWTEYEYAGLLSEQNAIYDRLNIELFVFRHRRNLSGYAQPKEQHMFISYPPSTPSVTYTSSAAAAAGLYCRGMPAGGGGSEGAGIGGSRAASTGSTVSAMLTCNSGVLRHHAVPSCCNNDDVTGGSSTEMMSPFDSMLFGGAGTACQDVLPSKSHTCTAHIPSMT